jgi:enoyl-CoA hydratase/carnithine racemase
MIQLMEELKNLEKDDSVRRIVLTGVAKSFTVGADIHEMQNLNSQSYSLEKSSIAWTASSNDFILLSKRVH